MYFFNFTDIIIPAFIIKFLKRFDCLKKINCYYKLGIIIYSITLFISSLNNFLFNYDIPFIFYMIPILSISTLILAFKRKEIKDILYSEKIEEEYSNNLNKTQEKIQLKLYEEEKEINLENLEYTLKSPNIEKNEDIIIEEDDIINIPSSSESEEYEDYEDEDSDD